jgi:hypothetical protein
MTFFFLQYHKNKVIRKTESSLSSFMELFVSLLTNSCKNGKERKRRKKKQKRERKAGEWVRVTMEVDFPTRKRY